MEMEMEPKSAGLRDALATRVDQLARAIISSGHLSFSSFQFSLTLLSLFNFSSTPLSEPSVSVIRLLSVLLVCFQVADAHPRV